MQTSEFFKNSEVYSAEPGSKLEKAKSPGAKIIDEDGLKKLAG